MKKKKRSATTTWFWSNKCLTWCSFVYHIFVMIKNNLSTKTPSGDNRLFCVKTNLGILFAVFHSLNIYCTPKGAKQTNRMNYSPSWYCAQNMVYKTVRCCFSFFFCFSLKTSGRMEKKTTNSRALDKMFWYDVTNSTIWHGWVYSLFFRICHSVVSA